MRGERRALSRPAANASLPRHHEHGGCGHEARQEKPTQDKCYGWHSCYFVNKKERRLPRPASSPTDFFLSSDLQAGTVSRATGTYSHKSYTIPVRDFGTRAGRHGYLAVLSTQQHL
jgi:hypothetical protein